MQGRIGAVIMLGMAVLGPSALPSAAAMADAVPATRLAIYQDDWDCQYPPAIEGNLCFTLDGTEKIDESRVRLRIDGTLIDVRPRVIETSRIVIFPLFFGVGTTEETRRQNRQLWSRLLGSPFDGPQVFAVAFDLEIANRLVMASDAEGQPVQPSFRLLRYEDDWMLFGFISAAAIVVGVTLMGIWSSALRDRSPVRQIAKGDLKFSLGKLQMAVWFCLIFAAFVFIWAVTSELGSLNSETFILLGISAGTALGSLVVDQSKASPAVSVEDRLEAAGLKTARDAARLQILVRRGRGAEPVERFYPAVAGDEVMAPAGARPATLADLHRMYLDETESFRSQGFVRDLLNDATGATVHRFQMLAWTIILGVIYVLRVYWDLQMPEFGTNLLTLMGISGGVYLGFKVPERQ